MSETKHKKQRKCLDKISVKSNVCENTVANSYENYYAWKLLWESKISLKSDFIKSVIKLL